MTRVRERHSISAAKPATGLAMALVAALAFGQGAASAQSGSPSGPRQTSTQNPVLGSVSSEKATAETISLGLSDAIDRALKQNLSLLLGNDSVLSAQGQAWQERSKLLPNLSARVAENAAQVNLAAQGFQKIAGSFQGFPLIVGPFGYFDMRAYFSQSVLDLNALHGQKAAERGVSAEQFSYQDARETVALVVGATYLDALTDAARVETAQAQVQTAQALYDQAADLRRNGISAGIDELRAQVELQTRQQELIAARNTLAKQNLVLARVIGLPLGQAFRLSNTVPYEAQAIPSVDDAMARAFAARADFQSAQSSIRAAEEQRRAATAEHLPSLSVNADYGVIGPTPSQTHGTYTASASLRIPIFAGNKAHGDALVAQAETDRRQQRLEDLRGQIEQDVRTSMLDLQAASDSVTVARSNIDLAQRTLTQARDRFSAGVSDNIEIVQAQESVARANESYISSLRDYNLARMQLARATGTAEKDIRQYGKEQ